MIGVAQGAVLPRNGAFADLNSVIGTQKVSRTAADPFYGRSIGRERARGLGTAPSLAKRTPAAGVADTEPNKTPRDRAGNDRTGRGHAATLGGPIGQMVLVYGRPGRRRQGGSRADVAGDEQTDTVVEVCSRNRSPRGGHLGGPSEDRASTRTWTTRPSRPGRQEST